jgi:thiamine pyrophosphokinase
MGTGIVQTHTFLTLLGGGSVTSAELAKALRFAPILVAADGGAHFAISQGIVPEAVIGDFDSLEDQTRTAIPRERFHQVDEQDTTDFEKCLARAKAPLILGVGLTGKRRDHELAAYHALMRYPAQRCLLIAEEDIIMLCPPKMSIDLPGGTRVSLFPMAPVTVNSTGLEWELSELKLEPGRRIGTSNVALGGSVELSVSKPNLLLILPVDKLPQLIAALEVNLSQWPTSV